MDERDKALAIAVNRLSGILDFTAVDILIVADWILTGNCELALTFEKQQADNYHKHHE